MLLRSLKNKLKLARESETLNTRHAIRHQGKNNQPKIRYLVFNKKKSLSKVLLRKARKKLLLLLLSFSWHHFNSFYRFKSSPSLQSLAEQLPLHQMDAL